SRRRHTRFSRDWSSDVCSSDLNTAVANAYAAVSAGVYTLDASVGGIGGCPFAPNATGNVATEDLVYVLSRSGYETGIDLEQLTEVARWLEAQRGRPVPSMLSKAGGFPKRAVAACSEARRLRPADDAPCARDIANFSRVHAQRCEPVRPVHLSV